MRNSTDGTNFFLRDGSTFAALKSRDATAFERFEFDDLNDLSEIPLPKGIPWIKAANARIDQQHIDNESSFIDMTAREVIGLQEIPVFKERITVRP